MFHSQTREISGLEGSSDGVLLLLQEVVLVLCLCGPIEQVRLCAAVVVSSHQPSRGFGISQGQESFTNILPNTILFFIIYNL